MRTSPSFAVAQRAGSDRAMDGVDLPGDVDHRMGPSFDGLVLAAPRRRSRLPRASSVASESSRCSQKWRNGSSQVSTSWSGRRVDGVEPPRAVRPDGREAAVAQDPEVLRDGRLRDPELGLDDRGDRPRGQLAIGEQLEDPPPDRVAQDVERVHRPIILEGMTYISQGCTSLPRSGRCTTGSLPGLTLARGGTIWSRHVGRTARESLVAASPVGALASPGTESTPCGAERGYRYPRRPGRVMSRPSTDRTDPCDPRDPADVEALRS